MALNYYEMRTRVAALVKDLIAKDKSNEEILYLAGMKYGATEKMVMGFIEQEEAEIARLLKLSAKKKVKK